MATEEYVVESDFIKVVLAEDATYGIVIKTIEHKVDSITLTATAGPLFSFDIRDLTETDTVATLTPTTGNAPTTGTYTTPTYGPDDGLGARSFFRWTGTFTAVESTASVLSWAWEAQILNSQPDRVRFALYRNWTTQDSSPDADYRTVLWCQPLMLSFAPWTQDHYLNAVNNGMSTRAPQTDLSGNGTTYQFKPDCKFQPESYDPETGNDDTYEVFYPGGASMPLTGYGSRTTNAVVYLHDGLEFRGTKMADTATSSAFTFNHRVLNNDCTIKYNSQPVNVAGSNYVTQSRYLSFFKAKTDLLGEEVGLNYRKWMTSSVEGRRTITSTRVPDETTAYLPSKPKDDALVASAAAFPFMVNVATGDYETGDTGYLNTILTELRTQFSALATTKIPLFLVDNNKHYENNDSKSDPSGLEEVPDLWCLYMDPAKQTRIVNIRTAISSPFSEIEIFSPQEWDHRSKFSGGDWGGDTSNDESGRRNQSGARSVNLIDAFRQLNEVKYRSTHQINTANNCSITAISYISDDGETEVTVSAGSSPGFDTNTWDYYSSDGGVNYLGMAVRASGGGSGTTPGLILQSGNIAGGAEVQYKTSRKFRVKGDFSSVWVAGGSPTVLLILYTLGYSRKIHGGTAIEQFHFLPGHDRSGGGVVTLKSTDSDSDNVAGTPTFSETITCPMADSYGNGGGTTYGPTGQLITDFAQYIGGTGQWMTGLSIRNFGRNCLICFDDRHIHSSGPQTFVHESGSPESIMGYRAVVKKLKTDANGKATLSDFFVYSEYGPADWQIGVFDGYTRAGCRNDLASSTGSWGQAGLFSTAFGGFYLGGPYRGDSGVGHLTGGDASVTSAETSRRPYAEAMICDWLFNRKLPTIQVTPTDAGRNNHGSGTSSFPGQANSWTPFYHGTWGSWKTGSLANMISQMAQVQLAWGLPYDGMRVRSLERTNPTTNTRTTFTNLTVEGYDLSPFEQGEARPTMPMACYIRAGEPRKVYAIITNELYQASGDSYRFVPSYYEDAIPGGIGAYEVTKHTITDSGYTSASEGWHDSEWTFNVFSTEGQIYVYEFDFSSGLKFVYRYEDDDLTSIPMRNEGARERLENIHGQGGRFQFGFKSHLPDEQIEITQVVLLVRGLGKSNHP